MNEPRRHHLLPQFYMRVFADERGQLRAVPRLGNNGPQTAYTASPENILVERDFYSITDDEGERQQLVEEAFARLEGKASDSLRRLLDDALVLDAEQRAVWSVGRDRGQRSGPILRADEQRADLLRSVLSTRSKLSGPVQGNRLSAAVGRRAQVAAALLVSIGRPGCVLRTSSSSSA
ncbi:MAG: DUF4238 domain-containing protein [Thermoleophilaceae bacterium]